MRYGIAVLAIIFFAIVGTIVLIGRGNSKTSSKPARVTKLADYDSKPSASVSWTWQGRLVGEDQRKAIRITVTPLTRKFEVLADYEQHVERTIEQVNTPVAFANFTRALDNYGFGRERTVKQTDERGMCPLGYVFLYRLTDGSKEVLRTWSDSCIASDGPFGGSSAQLISQLFKAQITDYNKLAIGVTL